MSSIALEPRTKGPRAGDLPANGGVSGARGGSSWVIGAMGLGHGLSRWRAGAGFVRVLAGEIAACPTLLAGAIILYVALIAPPLLALFPVAVTGLFLRVMGTLFGGVS